MSIETNAKIKITVDTNILISAFIYPGMTVVKIFDMIADGRLRLGLSEDILREFAGVCVRKFDYEPEDAIRYTEIIRQNTEIVRPKERVCVIRDEPDNRIIECAAEFKADYIISGDKHILEVKKYKGIQILPPAEFIKRLP